MTTTDWLRIASTQFTGFGAKTAMYRGNGARKLAVVVPGGGYTCDMPLLYYLTNHAADAGYDVVNVAYDEDTAHPIDKVALANDLATLLREGLASGGYDEVIVVCKSLGCRIFSTLLSTEPAVAAGVQKVVLITADYSDATITAIPSTFPHVLHIVGSLDKTKPPRRGLDKGATLQVLNLTKSDHGLDVPGDTYGSIENVKSVVKAFSTFVGIQ